MLDDDAVWLMEGHPLVDSNDQKDVNIYRLSVPTNEETNLNLIVYQGFPEIYVSYTHETDYTKFRDGPFTQKYGTPYLHVKIPAREELTDANRVGTYSKPIQYLSDGTNQIDMADTFVETEIYVAVRNPSSQTGTNYSISYTAGMLDYFLYDGQMIH